MLHGCGDGQDFEDWCSFPNNYYTITGADLKAVSYTGPAEAGYELLDTEVLENGSNAEADTFGLHVEASASYYTAETDAPKGFSIISTAHACSEPRPQTNQRIESLHLSSDTDFSSGYPAGSNLSPLFAVLYADARFEGSFGDNLGQYVADKPDAVIDMQLKPLATPAPGSHTFSITIDYSDGTRYSASSVSVVFD